MIYEFVTFWICNQYTQRDWDVDYYLTSKGTPIHSFYTQEAYTSPHYSWFHGSGTKLHLAKPDPPFARQLMGDPIIQTKQDSMIMRCNEIVQQIQTGEILPEYLLIADYGDAQEGFIGLEVCKVTIESLTRDNKQIYQLEHTFLGEMEWSDFRTGRPRQREKYLYHLDTASF